MYFTRTPFVQIGINQFSFYFGAESKRFKPNIRVVHKRDLNFMLRSEIFVNSNRQLQASHLIDRFLPSASLMAQQQQNQGKNQTPPPPPPARSRKRQHTTNQPPRGLGDAPPKTPPPWALGVIVIREPTIDARPAAQVGSNVASSSRPKVGW